MALCAVVPRAVVSSCFTLIGWQVGVFEVDMSEDVLHIAVIIF